MQTLKKTIVTVITAVLLLSLMGVSTVFADIGDTGMDGDFDWEETDTDAVTITAYTGVGGSVTIPATLSGKTVTAIAETAFIDEEEDPDEGEEPNIAHAGDVTDIIIQAPIASIAEGTFSGCTSLESVTFEVTSITEIGVNAFSGTPLTSIKIPASVETIGDNAFSDCADLASVTFDIGTTGSALTAIGSGAFSGTKLTSVKIPASVETIGDDAFSGCADLASLTFASEDNLASIGNNAFFDTKLVSITLPDSIESIGDYAFSATDETTLTKVVINNSDVTIGEGAFKWSRNLVIYGHRGSTADNFCLNATPDRIHFIALETTVGDTSITSVVSSGASRITITWTEADRATGYEIWRKGATGDYSQLATTTEGVLSYTDTGLTVSATYSYMVRGVNKPDTLPPYYGSFSDPVSATPLPGAPNSVYAVSMGYNSINVSWTPVSSASGYEIWRANDTIDGVYSLVKTLPCSISIWKIRPNQYKFTYLTSGRKYFYKIRAYVNVINPATGTTTKCYGAYSGITMGRPVPVAVTELTATPYSPTSIKLKWKSVSGRTRYEIWRKGPDNSDFVYYSSTSYTSYTNDRYIVVDNEYSYKIRAYRSSSTYGDVGSNGRIYGGFSNIASATPFVDQVTGVVARRYSNTKTKITWKSLRGVDGYELQWAESEDAPDEEWTTLYRGTSRSRYHSSLTDNTTYYYRVRAYEKTVISVDYPDGKSYGEWSEVDDATT